MTTRTQAQVPESQQSDAVVTNASVLNPALDRTSEVEKEPSQASESDENYFHESAFRGNFVRVPVRRGSTTLVQAKLVVGQPDDKYEREADRVANEVMSAPGPNSRHGYLSAPSIAHLYPQLNSPMQRQMTASQESDSEEEEEEPVQAKFLPPLRMNQIGTVAEDRLQRQTEEEEEEEEAVQAKALGPHPIQQMGSIAEDRLQRQTEEEEEEEETVQAKTPAPLSTQQIGSIAEDRLQRQTEEEEEETLVQSKGHSPQTPTVTADLGNSIKAARGGGQSLPSPSRNFMESRFNHDFSQVRVHTDGTANRLAKNLNAQAFTYKRDIFFGAGQYQPHTQTGQKLLAHELTHTIQQQPSSVRRQTYPHSSSLAANQRYDLRQHDVESHSPQIKQSTPVAPGKISKAATDAQNLISLRQNAPQVIEAPVSSLGPSATVQGPTVFEPSSSSPPNSNKAGSQAAESTNTELESGPDTDKNDVESRENLDTNVTDTEPTPSSPDEAPTSEVAEVAEVATESPEPSEIKEEEVAEVESLSLQGTSDQTVMKFVGSSPSQIAATQPSLGAQLDSKINQEQRSEATNAPILVAKTSGAVEEGLTPPEQISGSGEAQINDGVTETDPGDAQVNPHENLGEPPSNENNEKLLDRQEESSFLNWFRNNRQSFLNRIRTTDSTVNTRAGTRPNVQLEGEADPERMGKQRGDAESQLKAQRDKTTNTFKHHPGQRNIQPKEVNEGKPVHLNSEALVSIETPADTGAMDYVNAPLPPDVRAHADELLKPTLQANLAEAKAQTQNAAKTRDTDKAAKINQAKLDAAQVNQKADKDQRDIVVSNRQAVARQQKEGIEASFAQVNEFMVEADKEQIANHKEISTRVKDSEGEARKELEKGEADAEKERKAKEREAAAKKKELEEAQKNDSWWDRAVSAVKSAVKTITKAIDFVFTKLREAVKTIIEKAKNAAIALINKARTWIIDKLNKFRDWAKNQVNKYLKDRFPELAKRINEGIDSVVDTAIEGVNVVADAAIAGVEAVANGLTAALDKILSIFQTALKAAVQIVGAVITGDFAEALRIAVQAACDIAGIDSKPIFDFIDRAAGQIMAILKNPKAFFNNVMAAIGGGVGNFSKNIQQHLVKGLIGWLTGALSEVNLSLPETFDAPGILSLVMQILGLTYENIKAKVIKKFPPAAKVIGAVEQGIEIVQKLVTEGPMALWEEVKQSFSNLKETVMSGIRDFVIKTVVKEGITWLLSLLNPAAAIVKLLKLVFDLVMFLVERFQQIKDFVMSVYNSITAIASGNLSQAKKAVEDALSRSFPVVISLLASLAGLGGIGKTVKDIIGKVSKPVNKIIDNLIARMVKFAKNLFKRKTGREDEKITNEDRKKHKIIGERIKDKLKKPSSKKTDSFEEFYREKTEKAKKLEKENQPKLKKGMKLNISFGSIEKEKKDNDLDIKIKIAPNNYEDDIELPSKVQSILGKKLDSGQYKDIYLHKDDDQKVVAVPKDKGSVSVVKQEVEAIKKLNSLGIPSVKLLQVIEVDGVTSYVMKRYVANIKPTAFGESNLGLLNQNSINDLVNLRDLIKKEKIFIDDLQFLIDSQGNLVIADPMDIAEGGGFETNVRMIDGLLESAAENIIKEKLKENPDGLTREQLFSMINLDKDLIIEAITVLENPRFGQEIRQSNGKYTMNSE